MNRTGKLGPAGTFARAWIDSKLTPLVIVGSLLLGAFAFWKLPREEEPQIVVPMADVIARGSAGFWEIVLIHNGKVVTIYRDTALGSGNWMTQTVTLHNAVADAGSRCASP